MKRPKLENWRLVGGDQIVGQVFGHPKFEDGTEVWTSRVACLDLESGKAITKNSEYELGMPYDLTSDFR